MLKNMLHKQLGGQIDVKTDYGVIDLLTDDDIAIITECCNWRDAISDIIIYSYYYPSHQKIICLFGDIIINVDTITKICAEYDIVVMYTTL